MDIIIIIALVASSIIIAIIGVGFFNIFTDNSVECQEMNKDLYEHELAFNLSAEDYRYSANTLEGHFDLPSDLAAWRNHLLNEYNQLQYEINNFEDICEQ